MAHRISKFAVAAVFSLTVFSGNAATFTLLDKLGGANEYSAAYGVNDSGQVVGFSDKNLIGDSFGRFAMIWDGSTGTVGKLPLVIET